MRSVTATMGAGCAILFALPFAGAGLFALVAAMRAHGAGAPLERVFVMACFGIAFTAVGAAVIVGAFVGRKHVLRDEALRARHPNEPWLWNEEWASRRISDRSRLGVMLLWIFGILWNAISAPILFFIPRELAGGNYAVLVALLFPLIGISILFMAVRGTLRAIRFRRSVFVLDTLPAQVGGALQGRVEVDYTPLADAESIVVRLIALHRRRSGKSTTETLVWQEEYEVPRGTLVRTMNGVAIPVAVAIPDDAPTTQIDMPQTVWRLTVDGEIPGIDYTATFDVPVFRTATPPQRRAVPPHTPPPEPRNPEGYVVAQTTEGREIRFPAFRAKALAFVLLAVFLGTCGLVALMFRVDAPWFFRVIFSIALVPMFYALIDAFFGSSAVVFAGDRLIVRRHLLGRTRETSLPRREISSARARIGTQSGSRPYYEVELQSSDGRKVQVARYLRSKREAEWVAAQIHGR